ncbi:MAG: hypothetical protein AB7E81_09545 [Hyphomicrobiaceae bacterium]
MRLRTVAFVLLMLCALGITAARAEECHSKPVRANGGYGLMEATAKSRARSAWIKKVRGSKRLGKDYAAWLRAQNAGYACHKAGKRIACTASATPCRVER